MTHPYQNLNGASLEDCHTNFFALTELSGIKWRRLVWSGYGSGVGGGGLLEPEPLEEPVLRSYARCLAADILCVWRRVPTPPPPNVVFDMAPPPPSQPPPLSLATSKELWIFWYGEEPALHTLIAPELLKQDSEQGSWEGGLSYEGRSLLFKALHNLIERCLLSRQFVRLGRWFVQPYEGPRRTPAAEQHPSFSFAFFVHGESSVCAGVDIRQHPPVRRLSRTHLHRAQASTNGLQVILAPFGLAGTLTGQTYKSMESGTRLLEEWGHFYPIDKNAGENSVVEVIVGGVKMRYPACFVLVTDMDDSVNDTVMNGINGTNSANGSPLTKNGSMEGYILGTPVTVQTPPPSPVTISSKVPQPGPPFSVPLTNPASSQLPPTISTVLPERVWHECMHGGPATVPPAPYDANAGNWDFIDPLKKTTCICTKCRRYVGINAANGGSKCPAGGGKAASGSASAKSAAPMARVPFHRRSPPPHTPTAAPPPPAALGDAHANGHHGTASTTTTSSAATSDRCPGSYTPLGGPPSYPRTQESMVIPSVGSPASAAPSPLPNPHSQPASVPSGDQTMPTLSPHPPTVAESPMDTKNNTPEQPLKSVGSVANSPHPAADMKENATPNVMVTPSLKRPVLTSKEYEDALGEEEHNLDMLYDYSTMDAWLEHPVKRFKPDSKEYQRNIYLKNSDLYSMFTSNGVALNNNDPSKSVNNGNIQTPPFIKQEIKQEPMDNDSPPVLQSMGPHGLKRPGDPYEFDEDGSVKVEFATGQTPPKEEPKKLGGNLFTSEGLQPSYKDLDQIFDNSDDTSSDEVAQMQTPPGSNKSSGGVHDDSKRYTSTQMNNCPNVGILRPEELSKMFPTPPSLEHNPIASPCAQPELPPPELLDFGIMRIPQPAYPNMGSPQEENIEDWSYVFKPPSMCKLVGSSKYAPLTNLPSQSLPPVSLPSTSVYKPSWQQHVDKPAAAAAATTTTTSTTTTTPAQATPSGGTVPPPQATPTATVGAAFPPSPLHAAFRPPPPPYEMPSPATSTASSYLNKNLNSVEPVNTPCTVQRTPEASSLLMNVLLADTLLNIFRDHNFDSSMLCVCSAGSKLVGNIRGADASAYLPGERNASVNQQPHLPLPTSPYPGMNVVGQPPPYGSMLSPSQTGSAGSITADDPDSSRCTCGFSAVVNRKMAHRSGLFYEDEMEITGIAEDPGEHKKSSLLSYLLQNSNVKLDPNVDRDQLDMISYSILEMIREQCVMFPSTSNALLRSTQYLKRPAPPYSHSVNVLEYTDGNDITAAALDQSKHPDSLVMCSKMDERGGGGPKGTAYAVHKWPFLRAHGPRSNQDIIRVMRYLQPVLHDAILPKGMKDSRLWDPPCAVNGPLTWRQFHRLAGRGADDRCEPQPVPSVIIGHEKDWVSLSPFALHHWETLLLEPYSFSRDIAYIVVAPDNDAILPRVRSFFRELSASYEMCRLGRHSPITKVLRDGILRVGKTAKNKLGNEPVEDWFTLLGESEITDMLRLYAQVCKHHLAPHLQQVPMDKTLLDPPGEPMDKPAASPMPPPSTPDNSSQNSTSSDRGPTTPKSESDPDAKDPLLGSSCGPTPSSEMSHDDEEREAPSIVVYIVDPFTIGSDQPELHRLSCIALLRCFQSVLTAVPESIRSNISVQIISQESIVEMGKARERLKQVDHMRALALSIFSQCRKHLMHCNNVKSLTGFGTAAMADLFLKSKDEKNRAPYKLYTPPYILGPLKQKNEKADTFGQPKPEQSTVLYVSYCLSEDQSYLLSVATDEKGEIFETCTINIDIPNRSRRKKGTETARRIGLEKLMDFIIGIISHSVKPWRLVVGRLGRIGHGELKGWSHLLSRKNLLKTSMQLKEICTQCSLLCPTTVPIPANAPLPNNVPCILSGCLVSLEPESMFRLTSDILTPDERFSTINVAQPLITPQDVTCTHILVFPTSATSQNAQTTFQEQNSIDADEEFFNINDLHEDMNEGIDNINDFSDIFNWTDAGPGGGNSPSGSPRRDEMGNPGSPGLNSGRQVSPFPCANNSQRDGAEEVGSLLQQPLALGFLVSTAPTGRMPHWFWSSCPHLENVCPTFLKNALHLHSPNVHTSTEDILGQTAPPVLHSLDSQFTTDVLRYVLEGYNALSWLALDSNTRDRLSCLPVHIQVLSQLYHTMATLL